MFEKISEEQIRKEKIEKLKNKILAEIDDRLYCCKNKLTKDISNESFVLCIKDSFSLLNLKQYIKQEDFMRYEDMYPDKDIVIYKVSSNILDVWLQPSYNFAIKFLIIAREVGFDIFPLFDIYYFGYRFTDLIDIILCESDKTKNETHIS